MIIFLLFSDFGNMATPVLSMATSTLSLDDVKESLDDSGKTNVKILTSNHKH